MYIIMSMATISHKLRPPLIVLILVLKLFFAIEARAQNIQRVQPNEKIQSLTNKFLIPSNKSNCCKEVLRYIVMPSNSEPESAISMQNFADSSIVELITFRESISNQVMIQFIENSNDTVLKTSTVNYSVVISSELSNKLATLIDCLFNKQFDEERGNEIPLDGTLYSFSIFEDDRPKTLKFHSSQRDMLRNKVIKLFSTLSNHIKVGHVNECEIIATINEILVE